MRYKKIEIKNYKGIEHLIIDLDKQPLSRALTLVGLNESGKTSILEAINMLAIRVPLQKRHQLIPKNKKINFTDTISVSAIVEIDEKDKQKIEAFIYKKYGYDEIEISKEFSIFISYYFASSTPKDYGGIVNYNITISGKKRRAKKNLPLTEEKDEIIKFIHNNLLPKILYYPNFLHEFPNEIIIGNGDGELKTTVYTEIVQDILQSIDPKLSIEEHLLKRLINDSPSDKESLDSTLSKMSTKVSNKVFTAWSKLFNVGSKEIIISSGRKEDNTGKIIDYYLEFKLKEGSDKFNISERSLGFKWFFTFLLFTEFRTNRATETGEILFLLDEPASNLHSTAQKNLIETFKEIITKSRLIYTTHSHHLINPEWLSGVYIVRNKAIDYKNLFDSDSTNTDIEAIPYKQFIAKYPKDIDYFQPILDTLDYQPGLLEKIPEIIITEGKNDYYILKLAEILNRGTKKLNFFPGTGVDKLDDIIGLYLAWNKPFILIIDADKAAKRAKKTYLEKYGIELFDRLFTLDDVNKDWNGYTFEDIFSDTDKIEITKYFDSTVSKYEKGKFNSGIQNILLDNAKKLKLEDSTIINLKSLYAFIQEKMSLVKTAI